MINEMDDIIRINREKLKARMDAKESLRIIKIHPSLKSFMGSKKAIRKSQMDLKKKARGLK